MATSRAARQRELVKLWLQQPDEVKRSPSGLLIFYEWLQLRRPDLILEQRGKDPYLELEACLRAHLHE